MMKSKHFRKDVIIARVIFLVLCIILIAAIIWLVSMFTGSSGGGNTEGSETESQDSGYVDSESESESVSESESESETESESESETESETETESESETESEPETIYVEVTAKILNLRSEPNTTCAVVTSLRKGDKVEVLETLDGWYKVIYNGREGYLSADYAKVVEE